jgi:hemolysin D
MAIAFKQRLQALGDLLQHYKAVFQHVWQNRQQMEGKKFKPEEAEFLPAALALQETPVSPAPRVTMWLLIGFCAIMVLWAVFGKIDVVATAQGKIVPNDRTKVLQPFETSTVRKIFVTDGQVVKAGELLIELDARSATADVDRVDSDLASARMQAARARAFLAALQNNKPPQLNVEIAGVDPLKLEEARRMLDGQYQEYKSKQAGLDAETFKREAELQSTLTLVRKLEQTAPIAAQRSQDFKRLVAENFVSQHGYLEREQVRIEQEADLANQRSRSREIKASLLAAEYQKRSLAAETRRVALDSLNDANQKIASLEQELIKADTRAQSMLLTSPVDGIVQQLAIHTVGGVVTPAQTLMVIVPRDNALEVEAFVENKDVGFVQAGQDAVVKIETFEYTKYGTIPARITQLSNDAINDEKRGLIYSTRVKLDKANIRVDSKTVNLSPGMAVTVEIKTGKRRVIEYFLSPLLQHANEGLTER